MRINWYRISACFAVLTLCLLASGCAGVPTWLTDAESIVPVLVSGALSLVSLIAALTGNTVAASVLSEISAWAAKVEAGLKNLQTLVSEYKTTPGESLLDEIEGAVNLIVSDIGSFSAIVGVPAPLAAKIQELATFILTELESWASLLPALKATAKAGSKVTIIVPLSKDEFKTGLNNILNAPTGDVATDLALAKAKRV